MELKAKDYKVIDLFKLTFKNAPGCALLIAINKILFGFVPFFMVLGTAYFVDTALGIFHKTMKKEAIFPSLLFLIGIFVFQYTNWTLVRIVYAKMKNKLTELFHLATLEKRSRLAYKHIENDDTWNLVSQTCKDPAEHIINGYDNLFSILEGVIRVISLILIIIVEVWWAGILVIFLSIFLFFVSAMGESETYDAERESYQQERRAQYFSKVISKREKVEERTLFTYANKVNQLWFEKFEEVGKVVNRTYLKMLQKVKNSIIALLTIGIVILGGLLPALGNGSLSIGMFMGLVTAVLDLVQIMYGHMNWLIREFAKSVQYLKDLSTFFKLSEENTNQMPEDLLSKPSYIVEFHKVSFCYPGTERYVLKDCSFQLKENLHYVFVGMNGAGKTTITKLLTGMYDCFEGEILINGHSIRNYSFLQLREICSLVYQDFARYYISVEENIDSGNLSKEDVNCMEKIVRMIELEERVAKLPSGLQTILSKIKKEGMGLSGGEWQRIAIARNLYANASVSILDEPTAPLDLKVESKIYEMFDQISQGKSAIFTTHRLGAARLADEIIVIDAGRVVQQGSHETLRAQSGIYEDLFESQRGWYQ